MVGAGRRSGGSTIVPLGDAAAARDVLEPRDICCGFLWGVSLRIVGASPFNVG